MRKVIICTCTWVFLLATLSASAFAGTIYIKPDGTGDYPTIQAGLVAASPGDTVLVGCGTFYEHDLALTPGVCLKSETGLPDCVTIDAQGQGRAIACVDAGEGTVLEGFTITGGRVAGGGGGLFLMNAPILIARCVFRQNHAEHGGACFASLSPAQFEGCSFLENAADVPGPQAYFAGGALYCYECSPEFNGCEFIGNSGILNISGCAVFIYGPLALPQFINCLFENNVGAHTGGGIAIYAGATPTISSCVFRRNQGGSGGGIFVGTPSLTVERTLFDGNSAGLGGAVYFGWGGGAGSLTMCTLVSNSADEGGGVFVDATAGTPSVTQTIIVFGTKGQAIFCGGSSTPTLTNCDLYGNIGGNDLCGTDGGGNISADPLFCDRGAGDYTLSSTSPCVDNPGQGQIGASGVGCGPTAVQNTTWGRIKNMFR